MNGVKYIGHHLRIACGKIICFQLKGTTKKTFSKSKKKRNEIKYGRAKSVVDKTESERNSKSVSKKEVK